MKSKSLKTTSERSKPKSAVVVKPIKAVTEKKTDARKSNKSIKKVISKSDVKVFKPKTVVMKYTPQEVKVPVPAKSIWIKIAEWLWGKPW